MNNVHFQSKTPEWATPQAVFDKLNEEFHFTLDPCSTHENAKCSKHYTLEDDGLNQSWKGERVFMNPPYGRAIGGWIKKASECGAELVVCLIPARTDTRWFHDFIYGKAEVRFLKGRLKFGDGKQSAPFPSMIVIFSKS
jgi:site-specific DNA-methyltransferase (adenine-specific)